MRYWRIGKMSKKTLRIRKKGTKKWESWQTEDWCEDMEVEAALFAEEHCLKAGDIVVIDKQGEYEVDTWTEVVYVANEV